MNEWWLIGLFVGLVAIASMFLIIPFKHRFIASLLWVPIIGGAAFLGYFSWGGFAEWRQYTHRLDTQEQVQKVLQSIKSPQELIEKLRAKLDDSPKSAKGWYLLGRLYSSQNDRDQALHAFAKAYHFNPNEEQYAVNYAHSLWVKNNQQFTKQITGLFVRLLKNNPNQPDALAMLAMDAYVKHAYEDAISYWQRLLKLAPEQSEEAQAIRKAIAKAEERIKQVD